MPEAEGDADTGRREDFAAGDRKRVAQRLLNPERHRVGLLGIADRIQQDRELVAAQPGERVFFTQTRFQPPRNGGQQLIADQVAEAVVDDLEAVEIEVEGREPIAALLKLELGESLAEALDEHRAVAQAGQRIAEGGAPLLCLWRAMIRSVGERTGDAGRSLPGTTRGDAAAEKLPVRAVLVKD